jgi:TetR/AcrR family transcriptional regulator, regulator of autoinduction and epiphytic fitness
MTPRSRRAERAEQTRRRIVDAAATLFTDPGYSATTIETIAAKADVAVETVYSRFRNKATLLDAILGPAIAGDDDGGALFDRPDFVEIRAITDQREQLRRMARFSRDVLERTDVVHRILRTAAASDPHAAELQRSDELRRADAQRTYIELLLENGPLRDGLSADAAADTYAVLANPTNYAFLIRDRGWSPERFEAWLDDSLARLLLGIAGPSAGSAAPHGRGRSGPQRGKGSTR